MRLSALLFLCLTLLIHSSFTEMPSNAVIGELNGVNVYSNGDNSVHLAANGYRYGLKWQCVEFVKRYYKVHLDHEMPNVWGHAIDYFDPKVASGKLNSARGLVQFHNGATSPPKVNDLIVLDWAPPWGHVAIVSDVGTYFIEITQQNAGPAKMELDLSVKDGNYVVGSSTLGWLRRIVN